MFKDGFSSMLYMIDSINITKLLSSSVKIYFSGSERWLGIKYTFLNLDACTCTVSLESEFPFSLRRRNLHFSIFFLPY